MPGRHRVGRLPISGTGSGTTLVLYYFFLAPAFGLHMLPGMTKLD